MGQFQSERAARPLPDAGAIIEPVVSRRTVYALVGGLSFLAWVLYTMLLLFTGQLASVDEEWQGWGDVFLNPYLMAPWVLFGAGFVTFGLLHLRWIRR